MGDYRVKGTTTDVSNEINQMLRDARELLAA